MPLICKALAQGQIAPEMLEAIVMPKVIPKKGSHGTGCIAPEGFQYSNYSLDPISTTLMHWVGAMQPPARGRAEFLKGKGPNQGSSCAIVFGLGKEGIV